MNRQEVDIVRHIESQGEVKANELAERFGVSTRTVRSYVAGANRALGQTAQIVNSRGRGYSLKIADPQAFEGLLSRSEADAVQMPTTSAERVAYLMNDLATRSDWVTLEDLSAVLFVSERTLNRDLVEVEYELSLFDLSLERRPHYGLRVVGREFDRRLFLANLTMRRLGLFTESTDELGLRRISRCVDDVLTADRYQINSIAHQNLIVHIAIVLTRIRANCFVPMDHQHLSSVKQLGGYVTAQHIAEVIGDEFSIALPDEEVAYIAVHLSGKQSLQPFESEDDAEPVISDEVWGIVGEMLETVWESFRYDFRGDLELRMNLARHVVPLVARLTYRMRLENPLLSDIKGRFPLAYAMAVDACSVLKGRYATAPDEEETGYIALLFALALERRGSQMPKKRILVVCVSGEGSARLLKYRYQQEFGAYIDSIETCDVSRIAQVDFTQVDYVFTTVPLPQALPVPVRYVEFFLEDSTIRQIKEDLKAGPAEAAQYFSPQLFLPHCACTSKEEVVHSLCMAMSRIGLVSDEFEGLVWERESMAETHFGNGVAVPHPMVPASDRTVVAVALLDEPIDWGTGFVRVVFLVSISRSKGRDLDGLYKGLVNLSSDKEAIRNLLDHQSFRTLLSLF